MGLRDAYDYVNLHSTDLECFCLLYSFIYRLKSFLVKETISLFGVKVNGCAERL